MGAWGPACACAGAGADPFGTLPLKASIHSCSLTASTISATPTTPREDEHPCGPEACPRNAGHYAILTESACRCLNIEIVLMGSRRPAFLTFVDALSLPNQFRHGSPVFTCSFKPVGQAWPRQEKRLPHASHPSAIGSSSLQGAQPRLRTSASRQPTSRVSNLSPGRLSPEGQSNEASPSCLGHIGSS